jgi:predicted PurR-regulated permease PerM
VRGIFDHFRHRRGKLAGEAAPQAETVVAIDATALSRVFSAPVRLRDLGLLAWFLVGVVAILVGLVWLAGTLQTIVGPVLAGSLLACVAGPLVGRMQRHRIPRWLGALIVLLGIIAVGVLIFLLVVGGIVSESDSIEASAGDASDTIEGWLNDHGIDNTTELKNSIEQAVPDAGSTLINGSSTGSQGSRPSSSSFPSPLSASSSS